MPRLPAVPPHDRSCWRLPCCFRRRCSRCCCGTARKSAGPEELPDPAGYAALLAAPAGGQEMRVGGHRLPGLSVAVAVAVRRLLPAGRHHPENAAARARYDLDGPGDRLPRRLLETCHADYASHLLEEREGVADNEYRSGVDQH